MCTCDCAYLVQSGCHPRRKNPKREEPAIILPFSGSSFRVLSNRAIDSSFFKILRKRGAFPREVITARSELTPTKSPFRSAEHQHAQNRKLQMSSFGASWSRGLLERPRPCRSSSPGSVSGQFRWSFCSFSVLGRNAGSVSL